MFKVVRLADRHLRPAEVAAETRVHLDVPTPATRGLRRNASAFADLTAVTGSSLGSVLGPAPMRPPLEKRRCAPL